jgi:predicted S18 family serine protease
MKKIILALLLCYSFSSCETLMQTTGAGYPGVAVTEQEASTGIRQALSQGVSKGITYLNRTDGFFGNEAYKLFLPEEARKIENTLRSIGLGSQVDRAVLQINRAAEDAVGYAKPIFVEAITEMTLQDALNIVRGPKNAATNYFREKTNAKLVTAFSPVIKSSLDKVNATKYYTDIVTAYNRLPTTNKVNPDLTAYVVDRATTALFDQIEKEEANIRENPLARTTQILRKVFGTRN